MSCSTAAVGTVRTPPRSFLQRHSLQVAPALLGAEVISDLGGARVSVRLTEVEAYAGADDPGSHAFRGRTARNGSMFDVPGTLYVYFTYGMHFCANITCGPVGTAWAVLMRAGAVVDGVEAAGLRRPTARSVPELARGPARLAGCLGLGRDSDGIDLLDADSPVRLMVRGRSVPRSRIQVGPRVGLRNAADRPWRLWLAGEPTVSTYRPATSRIRRPRAGQPSKPSRR